MIYYIPLESSYFPLSNGIVVKVKFSHISYPLNLLFKYFIHLQCKNIANIRYIERYLIAYIVLLRTDNLELCSATLGPHLYWAGGLIGIGFCWVWLDVETNYTEQ